MPLPPSLRDGIYNLTLPLTNLIFGLSSLFYAPASNSPRIAYSIEALQKSEEESKVLKMFIFKTMWRRGIKMRDEEEAWSMETMHGSEGGWESEDEEEVEEGSEHGDDEEVLEKVRMV